jgi:DNA-binding transcriptional MerR regulator
MDKSPDAFRTISEVADVLETPAHVLRFWESRFPQIKPVKRAGGRRYYRPSDMALLAGIKRLLHDEGLTIRGVQKILRDQGVRHVAGLSDDSAPLDDGVIDHNPVDEQALDAADARMESAPEATLTDPHIEAAFIAVEDADDLGEPDPDLPVQAVLPLFDSPPPAKPKPAAARRLKPTLPEDTSFSRVIRALPPQALAASQAEVAVLVRRLALLRDKMAARAEGGHG